MADPQSQSSDEIDAELQDLIGSLDEQPQTPEGVEGPEASEQPQTPEPVAPKVEPKPKLKPAAPALEVSTPHSQPPAAPSTIQAQSTDNLDKLTGKYHKVFDELLTNMRDDRESIESYINVYAAQAQGDAPKQSFVEGLVALLGTKAKISADAVKLLDTTAKMVAASKSIALGDKGTVAPASELDKLMDASSFNPDAP